MATVDTKPLETPEVLDAQKDMAETEGELKSQSYGGPRRKAPRFRQIPRSPVSDVSNTKRGLHRKRGGERTRTASESSAVSGRSSYARRNSKGGFRPPRRNRTLSETSTISEGGETGTTLRSLRETVLEKYERKGLNLLNSFVKNKIDLSKFENTVNFLERCDALQVIPNKYRLSNDKIKNTKFVVRTLDRFSYQIMFVDLKYHRKRAFQVTKLLKEKEAMMTELFSEDLLAVVQETSQMLFERRSKRLAEQQEKIYESLLAEYEITDEEKADALERLKVRAERRKARLEQRARDSAKGDKTDREEEEEEEESQQEPKETNEDEKKEDLKASQDEASQDEEEAEDTNDEERKDGDPVE